MARVIKINQGGSGGSGTGWQGQVEFRSDLPITLGTPAIGDVWLVEKPTTILAGLYTTYQSGLYIRDFNNGNLNDWRKLNVKVKFTDGQFAIVNSIDESKQMKIDVAAITTGTTRIASLQDASGIIAYLADIPAGAGNNLYNIDGTLTGPRTVTMAGNLLQFDGGIVGLFTIDPVNNRIGIGTITPGYSLQVESGDVFIKDGVMGIGESPDATAGLRITTDGGEIYCQRSDVSYDTQTGNFFGLSIRSTTAKSGASSSLFGVNALLQGSASAGVHTATAITGRAESASGVGTMANIGGYFTALNGSTNYALRLVDGTEGAGKFLQSDAIGQTQWVNLPVGVNLYNADGALTSNRVVTLGNFSLNFSGLGGVVFDGGQHIVDVAGEIVLETSSPLGINLTTTGPTRPIVINASGTTTIGATGKTVIINDLTYPSLDGTIGQVLTTDGGGNLTFQDNLSSLKTKSGLVLAAAFTGNPKKTAPIVFATPFPSANYSIRITAHTQNNTTFSIDYESRTATGFVINSHVNNISNLIDVTWEASEIGEN